MNRLTRFAVAVAVAAIALLPTIAAAHRTWLLPSTTIVSGDDSWVTVDGGVSTEPFMADHQPLRLEAIKAFAPNGSEVKIENGATGKYRSTFDVHATQKGTYRISAGGFGGIRGGYTLNGEKKRLPRGTTAADLAGAIPAGATEVQIAEGSSANDTFFTVGEPTLGVLKPTGKGLEFAPVTHPNDLVMGEPARLGFLVDGRPAAGLKVTVLPGGSRYRNQTNEINLVTDARGQVTVKWPTPGYYWVNATATDKNVSVPQATERRMSYTATLEVLAP